MAERIRINPVGGTNFQAPKLPQLPMPGAQPVHMATRVPGATGMHSYLGHFATPTNLRAGHNTNWIAGATKNSHGQFREKAQRAGMSTRAYAEKEANAPGKLGEQARLAKTLMGMHR